MPLAFISLEMLPTVNACLNALATLCLLAGFWAIRTGRRDGHRNFMLGALAASAAFLTCYLIYHYHAPRTVFREPAWFRPIYLIILSTHTVLAMVIVPLVLMSLWRAFRRRFEAHRRLARWTLPLWLYVSVTGVLIYYLLYVKFPQPAAPMPLRAGAEPASAVLPAARCTPGETVLSGGRPSSTSRMSCNKVVVA